MFYWLHFEFVNISASASANFINISVCFFIAGNLEDFYEEDNEKNCSIVIMSYIFNRIHDLPDYGMMLLLIQEGISTFFLMFQICLLQFIMISLTLSEVEL